MVLGVQGEWSPLSHEKSMVLALVGVLAKCPCPCVGFENIFKAASIQHEFSPRRTGCSWGQMTEEVEARSDVKAAKTTKVSFGCGFQRTIEEECGHRLSGRKERSFPLHPPMNSSTRLQIKKWGPKLQSTLFSLGIISHRYP